MFAPPARNCVRRLAAAPSKEPTRTVQSQMPLYPEEASNFAPSVDALMIYITLVCLFFAVVITAAIVFFFFRYHRKKPGDIGGQGHEESRLEALLLVVAAILGF